MTSIKNITRKLVNAGFDEDELMMMTEKQIREAYRTFKKEMEEIVMENNTATNNITTEEEIDMIKEMNKLAMDYDCFTHCIDDYSQQKEAENHNHELAVKFVEVANKMGINATKDDLYEIASSDKSIDEAIEAYIKSHEIKVVSSTLTEQNGELTFVELSPEQKIQISDVLDDQLQDINYSSWFEEENGVFKLYGGWVDEDSAVKEEYYFNGNKLIKIEREEITMKEMRGTDIFFEFKEDFSLVETWADAWVDYNTEENEKLIKEVTNMRYPLALQAAKIAVKSINPKETMSYRILSADRKFWCDCGISADNTIIIKTACALEGDSPKIKNGYGCIHDFKTGVEAKEEVIMKNNNATTKEEVKMNTEKSTVNNAIEAKEDIIMTRTVQELIDDALNIKKISNKRYVTRLMLRNKYKELTGEIIRDKRSGMIKKLQEYIESNTVIEDDFCNDKASKGEPDNTIVAGDFCRDNAPESIEEPTPKLSQDMAAKILKKVICQADTNKAHNFISNWMLTSAISEVLFGTPLKEKKNGNVIEHWKGFSKEQNKMLAYIHKEFVNKSGFVAKKKDDTIVGYVIPAKVLVWGRHKYLNKVCVYKVVDKYGKSLAEYQVSMNGIKNTATGKMIPLTADCYDTLDTKCVFIR